MTRITSSSELEDLRQRIASERSQDAPCITVCAGTGCLASGLRVVVAAFNREIEAQGLEVELGFRSTGCHGFCEKGPIVVIDPEEICYPQVTPEHVSEIIDMKIRGK